MLANSGPNRSHWNLEKDEIDSLSTPLSEILTDMGLSMGDQASPYASLALVCFMVFGPRVAIELQNRPARPAKAPAPSTPPASNAGRVSVPAPQGGAIYGNSGTGTNGAAPGGAAGSNGTGNLGEPTYSLPGNPGL